MTLPCLACLLSPPQTSLPDLAKLTAVCEDDAREAAPLVEKDAQWVGNRIRIQLIYRAADPPGRRIRRPVTLC